MILTKLRPRQYSLATRLCLPAGLVAASGCETAGAGFWEGKKAWTTHVTIPAIAPAPLVSWRRYGYFSAGLRGTDDGAAWQ